MLRSDASLVRQLDLDDTFLLLRHIDGEDPVLRERRVDVLLSRVAGDVEIPAEGPGARAAPLPRLDTALHRQGLVVLQDFDLAGDVLLYVHHQLVSVLLLGEADGLAVGLKARVPQPPEHFVVERRRRRRLRRWRRRRGRRGPAGRPGGADRGGSPSWRSAQVILVLRRPTRIGSCRSVARGVTRERRAAVCRRGAASSGRRAASVSTADGRTVEVVRSSGRLQRGVPHGRRPRARRSPRRIWGPPS